MSLSLGDGATAAKVEGRDDVSRWRGEATGSTLAGGATAKLEGRVGFSRWRGEETGSSLGSGATAEAWLC